MRFFARRSAILAVIALPFAAWAQLEPAGPPQRIALLNAAVDQQVGQQSVRALRRALLNDDQFNPLQPGPLANVLELKMSLDPDADINAAVARADEALLAATEAFSNLEDKEAQRQLKRAETALVSVRPKPAVIQRLAEINFQLGLVHMRRQDSVSAAASFRVAMRLAPDRAPPDPGVYDPDIIKAYETAASLPQAKTASVRVVAPFDGADVYIDGANVGVTPYDATIEPGAHYFWGTMPDKQGFGARLTALVDEPREMSLQIRRIPDDQIAARVRAGLLHGGSIDEVSISAAVVAVYQLTLVKYVVVVTQRPDGPLNVAVFNPSGRRLTEWAELTPESAADVIKALPGRINLDPDPLPETPDAGLGNIPIPPKRPLYREPIAYLAIGGVTIIVLVSVFIIANSDEAPAKVIDGACCGPF